MTRAPRLTAHLIAFASTAASMSPSAVATLATSSRAGNAMPATPSALSTSAAMRPATNVPWPSGSSADPPTKLLAATMLFVRSGWPRSMPVSMTATVTGSSSGRSAQKSNART